MRSIFLICFFLLSGILTCFANEVNNGPYPNIIFILADDMGYGDVGALNPEGKIKTPHLDQLAQQGMYFTDMHTTSSVCTPTRYSLLTGRYNWRTRLKEGVLWGYSTPLIEPNRETLASLLKKRGYRTAVVGKWHLGLDWALHDTAISVDQSEKNDGRNIDFTQPIKGGPNDLGFDWFFGISASLDMPPFVYIENDRVVQIPSTKKTWLREGLASEDFEAQDVLPELTRRANSYIEKVVQESRAKGTNEPFFLYFPLNAPHTPILPSPQWKGKSGLNDYADFVMEVDDTVGSLCQTLERLGIVDNTMIVFTSDNGCSPMANIKELNEKGHYPNGPFRGVKADIFDGGHRVPFVVRWPARIAAGSRCDQLASLVDMMRTFAAIVNVELPSGVAHDSVNLYDALLQTAKGPLRQELIHHSINGSFAIRQGDWKLNLCPDSGGWSFPRPNSPQVKTLPPLQLYQMKEDQGEIANLQDHFPEKVQQMKESLTRTITHEAEFLE